MGFSSLLDPVLNPLLSLSPFWVLFSISLILSVLINLAFKFFTDQKLLKQVKEEMKAMQQELKTLKNDPEKFASHQKKILEKNMVSFRQSMKVNLITLIPMLVFIGWLSAHFAYAPLYPNEVFDVSLVFNPGSSGMVTLNPDGLKTTSPLEKVIVNDKVSWALAGDVGEYLLEFNYSGNIYEKKVLVTDSQKYENPVHSVNDGSLSSIVVGNKELKPLGDFSLFGWKPGWLGTYFILAIFFSLLTRKLMKIH